MKALCRAGVCDKVSTSGKKLHRSIARMPLQWIEPAQIKIQCHDRRHGGGEMMQVRNPRCLLLQVGHIAAERQRALMEWPISSNM